MCGRFAQFNPVAALKDLFDIDSVTCDVYPSYNIAPTHEVLSIIRHRGNRLGKLHWGLIPFWSKELKKSKGVINARAEILHEKPSFKGLLKKKRCLIPADGFYEWKKDGKVKTPCYIFQPSGRGFAFAGLWDRWTNDDGEVYHSCTIVTREARGKISEIHHRMPAILTMEAASAWLDPDHNDPEIVLKEGCVSDLDYYPVDKRVNSVSVNDPECIKPAGEVSG